MLCACSSVYAEPRVLLPPVVDNSTYPGGSAYSSSAPSNNAMYEVLGRLEQMQIEIQQLRGVVEEQSQTIIDLKKRQSNIYSDLDLRLQELTGGHVKTVASVDSETSVGNSKSSVENSVDNAIVAKGVKETAAPVKQDSKLNEIVDEAPVLNQKEMYQSAYETLRNGHNTRAISAFKTLLAEFPAGEYADNSQYWLAEAYKVNQDLNSAKAAFTKVVTQYSNSPKVPDALLKLGYIELEQNNKAKARDYLTQVTVNYPGTTAAHLAAKKLRQIEDIQP